MRYGGEGGTPNEQRRFESRIRKALDLADGFVTSSIAVRRFTRSFSALIKDNQIDRAQDLAREITVDMILEKTGTELRAAQALPE
jgi:hypothetical protein